jgi:multiple sugar transport system substrate-binding protein
LPHEFAAWRRRLGNQASHQGETLKTWQQLAPYYSARWHKNSWRDAAKQLARGEAGIFFIGGFLAEELDGETDQIKDLRAFAFPPVQENGNSKGVDAPIDGFVFPAKAKARRAQKCRKSMEAFVDYLATEKAYWAYDRGNPGSSLSVLDRDFFHDQSYRYQVQKEAARILLANSSGHTVRAFLDREYYRHSDVKDVIVPELQAFLTMSAGRMEIDDILSRMQSDLRGR